VTVFRPAALRTLRRSRGPSARTRAGALLGAGTVAGAAFGAVAAASARRATDAADLELHGAMREGLRGPAADAAEAVAPAVDAAAKWWVYAPVALAAAAGVLAAPSPSPRVRRGRRAGAVALAAVPAVASALSPAFDRWLPQPPTGPRRRPVDHPVFPSGHAFRTTAVALVAAYVATREGLVRARGVWPAAAGASLAVGVSRLVREKHLASDVAGGWLAGVALAALTAGAYELARDARPRRRGR
jgi:membrane-associated phospholipid phosphatase